MLLVTLLFTLLLALLFCSLSSSETYEDDSCNLYVDNGYFGANSSTEQQCTEFVSLCGNSSNQTLISEALIQNGANLREIQGRISSVYDDAMQDAQYGICP